MIVHHDARSYYEVYYLPLAWFHSCASHLRLGYAFYADVSHRRRAVPISAAQIGTYVQLEGARHGEHGKLPPSIVPGAVTRFAIGISCVSQPV